MCYSFLQKKGGAGEGEGEKEAAAMRCMYRFCGPVPGPSPADFLGRDGGPCLAGSCMWANAYVTALSTVRGTDKLS